MVLHIQLNLGLKKMGSSLTSETPTVKILKGKELSDERRFLTWREKFIEYVIEKDGWENELDRYNPVFIREYYARGLTAEQTYKECKSDLLLPEDDEACWGSDGLTFEEEGI